MNKQWYWAAAGLKHGPCSRAEIAEAARSGKISPEDYLWHPDFGAAWRKAGEFEEFFAIPKPEIEPPASSGEPVAEEEPISKSPVWKARPTMLGTVIDALTRTFSVFIQHSSWRRWLGIGFCVWICSITGFGAIFSDLFKELDGVRELLFSELLTKEKFDAIATKLINFAAGKTVSFVDGGFGLRGESAMESLILLGLALWACWLRSRGDFLLLQRWYEPDVTLREGWMLPRILSNTVFHWRIASTTVGLLLMGACSILPYLSLVRPYVENGFSLPEAALETGGIWLDISLWALGVIAVGLLLLFVLTNYFMVPILYRHPELGIGGAWRRIGSFILHNPFGLIRFFVVLWLLQFMFSTLLMGFVTCTMGLGFQLLALPYVGSVIVAPMQYCMRGFAALWLGRSTDDLAERE